MSNLRAVVLVVVVGIVLVGGVLAYSVLRPPEEASGPIEAIPIAASTAGPAATAAASSDPTAAAPAATAASTTAAAPAATAAPATAAPVEDATAAPQAAASSDPVVVQIVQEESEARFVIDEVLNNAPVTVVGTTNQVAGEIAVDAQDPTQTRVGIIQVNARSLATDNDFRNRAIKNRILETDQYEFVTFAPSEIVGLPQTGAVGESYSFQIVGDLTIRDVTRSVTFDVTITATSETRLEGTATATINYPDYEITIPQVPQVASVDEQVRLEIDFVATTA